MGDKTIPDSAEPRLESFYPAGIDLPHQGVVDSYNLKCDLRQYKMIKSLKLNQLLTYAGGCFDQSFITMTVSNFVLGRNFGDQILKSFSALSHYPKQLCRIFAKNQTEYSM